MLDEENKKQREHEGSSGDKLGEHGYQFFVHSLTALDYQFSEPQSKSLSAGQISNASQATAASSSASASASATWTASTLPSSSKLSSSSAAVCAGGTDRYITDQNGAIVVYPLWQLLPSSVTYANGTKASFEYDANDEVCQIVEVPGVTWRRGDSTKGCFHTWTRSDGNSGYMQVTVFADGNYQMVLESGNVYTFTTAGRRFLGKPFKPGFDLATSLPRVFKRLEKNGNGLLCKDEINQGVLIHWDHQDDAQLVSMLKLHYELIQICRRNALLKLGAGISIPDIQEYDRRMRNAASPNASNEHMKTVEQLFDSIDENKDHNVSLAEIKEQVDRMPLSDAQKKSLKYLITHTEKLHVFTARGYLDRTQRMTRDEFMAHYQQIYRDEIGKYNSAGGWGIEKVWRATMQAKRSLFADKENALASIRQEAIKQGRVGDCLFLSALGSIIAVRPELILKSIVDNGNETYTVTFMGAQDIPIAVSAPTSSELALYAKGSAYGMWAPLMEKAYGMLIAKRRNSPAVIPAENTATKANMKCLEILTGAASRWEYTQDSTSVALGICRRSMSVNELRNLLSNCFAQRRAIIAASLFGAEAESDEPAIVGGHAYSIIGWDLEKDLVKIRNPWGIVPLNVKRADNFGLTPGTELKEDGSNGIFALPLPSFYKKFAALCIESTRDKEH